GKAAGQSVGIERSRLLFEIKKSGGAEHRDIAGDQRFGEVAAAARAEAVVDDLEIALHFGFGGGAGGGGSPGVPQQARRGARGGGGITEKTTVSFSRRGILYRTIHFEPAIGDAGHSFFGCVGAAGEAGAGTEEARGIGTDLLSGKQRHFHLMHGGLGSDVEGP